MKKISILSLALSSLFLVNANALNLDEAIDIALNKNLDIKSSEFTYMKSIQSLKQSNSAYLPKLDLGYAYNNTDEAVFNNNQSETTALSATVSYNLFNGFKDLANKNASKYLSQSSKYSLNATKQDIVLSVKSAYINYLNAQNSLKTYNSAYELFKEQYEDSKNRYNQGLIARNDLLQVQVNMSSAKQNVVQAKGDLKVVKYQLSNVLGGIDLTNENIENLDEKTLSIKDYDKSKLSQRSEIQALEMALKSFNQQIKATKSSYYPTVDISASHNKYYDTFSLNKYEAIPNVDNQNSANITASWNLYSGGSTMAQVENSKIDYKNAINQLDKTKLDINLQYENAKSNLEVAIDNLDTSKLSLIQAKENYEIVKNRFDEGLATTTDLTDANYLLTQAQQGYNKAYFDKYLAIASLDRIFEINKY
ncbi:outer membrane channel protein TolC [Malaciobacter pacificus]|uniref:RND family efflux system, outer membrane channel protein, TolC family n=1 Tax=Malaciobacter pacificus TaxID=1080223 RepID=A0A5C2H490_9BACT|nr:TolC family protein [Malaciobacter pacificus]QEP33807.1 RND family efflux system, outer membrane channel protein, TolC family [Malaciobacter pacificus]GGD33514.1 outer membrane channel protein TolC [Malaciobacter pacificus]